MGTARGLAEVFWGGWVFNGDIPAKFSSDLHFFRWRSQEFSPGGPKSTEVNGWR